MATSLQIVIDCADPAGLAPFWATALGYVLQDPPEGYDSWEEWLADAGIPEEEWNAASAVVDPEGHGPRLYLQRVPETKSVKNRMHLDLNAGGAPTTPLAERVANVDREVARLLEAGATIVRPGAEERGEYWVVCADPEGNEFCVQ